MENLFPLPLTAFEKVMLLYDRPNFPMTFVIEFHFLGQLHPPALEEALALVAPRHPMLHCRLERTTAAWVWPGSARPVPVYWSDHPGNFDLTQQGGVRAFAQSASGRTRLTFEFHHAVCDGQGAAMFLRDFAQAYQQIRGSGPVQSWSRSQLAPLQDRGLLPARPSQESPPLLQSLGFVLDFLLTRPHSVAGGAPVVSGPRRGMARHTFAAAESGAWLAGHSGNLNDLALTALFGALASWQSRFKSGGRVRVLMPTSLRSLSDMRAGACNRTSFAFLSRPLQTCLGPLPQLYAGICQETDFIKRFRPDLATLIGMQWLDRTHLLAPFMALPLRFSTAVFTNMGKVNPSRPQFGVENGNLKIGDVLLESVVGTPPVQPRTGMAVGLSQLEDKVSIGLRCDPTRFSPSQEQALLDLFVARWRSLVGSPNERRSATTRG